MLTHTVKQFWELPDQTPNLRSRPATFSQTDWPAPAPFGDELPAVDDFQLELLPSSLRPLVDDVSERMQTPPDYAAVAAVVTLAGCVNRRALITPKAEDLSWSVVPNLWGAIVGSPGFMKSPVLRAITLPLARIEDLWRAEYAEASSEYETAKEQAELRHQAWREECKRAYKNNKSVPIEPDTPISAPTQKRLVLTDATFEKLHEILGENPGGVLVVRDELTGWLAQLDKQGREGERGFFLQAWNGDGGFTIDRIGRGSIHVPAVCVSLLGNIQPGRLRGYLSEVLEGGPTDDGLFQRFQLLVWPDPPRNWRLVDRLPNRAAAVAAENVYVRLANLSSDSPVQMRFDSDAQQLFNEWWTALENTLRNNSALSPSLVAHFAKYRSLLPSLAGLFELADLAAAENLGAAALVSLNHTRQAAAMCDFLGDHARRVYASVISPECRAARELARHIQIKDVPAVFALRSILPRRLEWTGLGGASPRSTFATRGRRVGAPRSISTPSERRAPFRGMAGEPEGGAS
ncbi:MAG TPA: YfjI family protein [Candidatus Acidoferrales bacterium]